MNAQERLHAARSAAREGRFAEALREFIWFHEHALEEQPSMRGVRLSFALGYWLELAGQYLPARAALQRIRNEKTERLEQGEEDRELFSDVCAINRELGNEEATYDLFRSINDSNAAFAARCAAVAMPAMVKAFDFKLARSFISDPRKAIERLASRFIQGIERANRSSLPEKQAAITEVEIRIYAQEVGMLAHIVCMAGDEQQADALIEQGISLAGGAALQDAVRAALTP